MVAKQRVIFLMTMMVACIFSVLIITMVFLYRTAVGQECFRLEEIAKIQARHIESMARFERSQHAANGTLKENQILEDILGQLIETHEHYKGFGHTGEITLAKKVKDNIVFLLPHRHYDYNHPKKVRMNGKWAEPMRRALNGKSGSLIGLDYRGVTVLAAHEPIKDLGLGIVAKLDMAEIRIPFIKTGAFISAMTLIVVLLAVTIFLKTTNPILNRLAKDKLELQKVNDGLKREIAQHARTENELKHSERLRRTLIEYAQDAIFLFDGDSGRILEANQSALALTGQGLKEIRQMQSKDLFPEDGADFEDNYRKVLEDGIEIPLKEMTLISKNGAKIKVEARTNLIPMEDRHLIIGIFRNIEARIQAEKKRKNLEIQLQQAQKMEAIGRLAGGVAHDFNNLLSIILGYSGMELDELDEESTHWEALTEIHSAAERAQALTRQLLAFSRKQTLELKVVDINLVMEGLKKLLARVINEDIDFRFVLASTKCCARADISQLEQIILNLCVNARDAMPNGGKLTIETALVYLDRNCTTRRPSVIAGDYVMFSVSDTGIGMTQETLDQAFEPFFTTKEKEKGTGLGLSTVYGIVKQHGGYVWGYSEPGLGSSFKVYLPQVNDLEECIVPFKTSQVPKPVGSVIMVVEDDPVLRKLTVNVLEKSGHQVISTENAPAAVDIARNIAVPIHLLLTDVIMPELKGPEVYQQIRMAHPQMKVLYMSGYTDDVIVRHGILDDGVRYLQKPFSAKSLQDKINEVLSA